MSDTTKTKQPPAARLRATSPTTSATAKAEKRSGPASVLPGRIRTATASTSSSNADAARRPASFSASPRRRRSNSPAGRAHGSARRFFSQTRKGIRP